MEFDLPDGGEGGEHGGVGVVATSKISMMHDAMLFETENFDRVFLS